MGFGVTNSPDFFFFFVIYFAWSEHVKVPASHTEIGFWIVSPMWDSVLESDEHFLGFVAALQGSRTGVPRSLAPEAMGKRGNAPDNKGDSTGTVWIHDSDPRPNMNFSSSCLTLQVEPHSLHLI